VGLPGALAAPQSKAYFAAVDAVLARDVFYPGDKPVDNELSPDETLVSALDEFQKAGKPVFVTERLTDPDKIADFLTRAKTKGYVPDAALAPPVVPAPSAPPTPSPVSPLVADARG
jgi:endo-alpha-1,4-polygalactosaminidase (GH114 family)